MSAAARARFRTSHLKYALKSAACVRESVRFVVAERSRRRSAGWYRLRRNGHRIHIRHPEVDMWILHEIYGRGVYRPPPNVLHLAERLGSPHIIDVGAHVGLASIFFLDLWPRSSVLAVEPDPDQAEIIRQTVTRNDLSRRWSVVECCAAVKEGEVPFVRDYHGSRADPSAASSSVGTMDILPVLKSAQIAKIDIQGGEWEILQDERFAACGPPVLVVEYHPWSCPGEVPDEEARRLLDSAGYETGESFDVHADEGTLWAWR